MSKVLVLCGRTCTGKDTFGKYLENNFGFKKIVSITTRPKREGEVDGRDYVFMEGNGFNILDSKNIIFAETTEYLQEDGSVWMYGSLTADYRINSKKDVNKYIILNPEGVRQLIENGIEFDLLYFTEDRYEVLKERYLNREPNADRKKLEEKFQVRWEQDQKDFVNFKTDFMDYVSACIGEIDFNNKDIIKSIIFAIEHSYESIYTDLEKIRKEYLHLLASSCNREFALDDNYDILKDVMTRLWDIAKISPEHGNVLMDILGDESYDFVSRFNHFLV